MSIIINGRTGPVRGRTRISYDPNNGLQVTVPWESAGNNLAGIAAQYQRARVSYELEANDRKSTLVARASGGQLGIPNVVTDEWEVLLNEIQFDIWFNPVLRRNLTISTIQELKKVVETGGDQTDLAKSITDLTQRALANRYFNQITTGTDKFEFGQYVLRHSTNVSNNFDVNVADINVEKIYTTAQLLAECTNPASWVYPLPGRLVYKIENLMTWPDQADYIWGWRKLGAREHTVAGNRVAIVTEYWLGQISTLLYDPLA